MSQFKRSLSGRHHTRGRERPAAAPVARMDAWDLLKILAMILPPLVLLVFAIRASADQNVPGGSGQPETVVRATTERLDTMISERRTAFRTDRQLFHATVDQVVAPAFDFEYASQLVLGRAWRTANDEQRARFSRAFKNRLIDMYGDALLDQTDSYEIRWLQTTTSDGGTEATVHANVVRRTGPPIQVGFALHRGPDGAWRVYDITLDAISVVTSFRGQYATVVRSQGLDGLIQRLEAMDSKGGAAAVQAQG